MEIDLNISERGFVELTKVVIHTLWFLEFSLMIVIHTAKKMISFQKLAFFIGINVCGAFDFSNLHGMRMQAASLDELPPGIYIVGGKKVVIK